MTDPPDDLEPLLEPKPGAEPAGFRDALFQRTTRQLTWRRWTRRAATAAGIAAVFVGGGAIGWVVKPSSAAVDAPAAELVFVFVPMPEPAISGGLTSPGSPIVTPDSPGTAAEAEVQAELADDRTEAARLYRLAGDKYLNDRQDYANAARCYRLFLTRSGDTALSPEPADTWLLTSLKNAAFKEKLDVAKTGG